MSRMRYLQFKLHIFTLCQKSSFKEISSNKPYPAWAAGMYNKRNWAYAEPASDDTGDSAPPAPKHRVRKPTAVAPPATWERYHQQERDALAAVHRVSALVGHATRDAAASSSESILQLTRPPKGLTAAGDAPGGQMGYWAADLERVRDEIGGETAVSVTCFWAPPSPPPPTFAALCDPPRYHFRGASVAPPLPADQRLCALPTSHAHRPNR